VPADGYFEWQKIDAKMIVPIALALTSSDQALRI
jgi:hypothetical protein